MVPWFSNGPEQAAGAVNWRKIVPWRELGAGSRTEDASGHVTEGVLAGSVIGTLLQVPLLALNPELADLVLARAMGRTEPWPTLAAPSVERARTQRIAEARIERMAPASPVEIIGEGTRDGGGPQHRERSRRLRVRTRGGGPWAAGG